MKLILRVLAECVVVFAVIGVLMFELGEDAACKRAGGTFIFDKETQLHHCDWGDGNFMKSMEQLNPAQFIK